MFRYVCDQEQESKVTERHMVLVPSTSVKKNSPFSFFLTHNANSIMYIIKKLVALHTKLWNFSSF